MYIIYFVLVDIRDQISIDLKDILYYINLKFLNRPSKAYYWGNNRMLAHAKMPNYPNNCHEVDIGHLTKNLSGFHQIQFNFRPDPRVHVEVMIEDRQQSLTRSYKYNKYGSVGSRMTIMNLTRNTYRFVQVRGNV